MRQGIYAIVDHVAEDIAGNFVHIIRAEPAAIRLFSDIALGENSKIGMHPADFSLVRLGWLETDLTITPDNKTIITGEQWLAAQQGAPKP